MNVAARIRSGPVGTLMGTHNITLRIDASGLGCHGARVIDRREGAISQQKPMGYVGLVSI